MRQLLNVAFTILAEGRDDNELDDWIRELEAEPGVKPRRRSRVDPGLLGMLGGPA